MQDAVQNLQHHFAGDIIEPDAPQYASARAAKFAAGQPALILRPTTVTDVQAAVRYAVDLGLAMAVRSGGHSFPGFGTNDGGVVIDLGGLTGVEVIDKERHLVRIGGGATWGEVTNSLAPHGLAISSGDTKSVGVGGLTLTGGIGWTVRKHGLTLDNLVGAEIVTADGEINSVGEQEHPDLFWAIRGGGGNFGIVTSFVFVAHPTTDLYFGKIKFPAAETATVLRGWADYLNHAPDDLTSIVTLANPMAGGPQAPVEIAVAFDGDDPQRAAEAIDPIRRLGTVLDDDVSLRAYPDILVDGGAPPAGIQLITRSSFVDSESVPEVLDILAEVGTSERSPVIAIRSVGGAVSRIAPDATAYAYRRAELLIILTTAGPQPVVEAARPGVDAVWARLAPHTDGAYGNFLTAAGDQDVARIYPAATYRRLADVKRRYDPGNLFAGNHNVRPQ